MRYTQELQKTTGWLGLAILVLAGCSADIDRRFAPADGGEQHAVVVDVPSPLLGLTTVRTTRLGEPVNVRCATCHSLMDTEEPGSPTQLPDEFHADIELVHGTLTCRSCHVRGGDAEHFNLASGEILDGPEGRVLCGQCHAPRHRDYMRSGHGGMTGYWDLTRGSRQRNDCVTCHNPHQPAFPSFTPAPGPRDRFLPTGGSHQEFGETGTNETSQPGHQGSR